MSKFFTATEKESGNKCLINLNKVKFIFQRESDTRIVFDGLPNILHIDVVESTDEICKNILSFEAE